jgi:LysM repeat protein
MNIRRLAVYLVLNAVVSVSATYAVLWYWDRTHPSGPARATLEAPATAAAAATQEAATEDAPAPGPTFTLPPAGETAQAGPTPTIYVVQAGDTMSTIAQRYGVTVDDILAANGLSDPNILSIGQNLIIPVEGYTPPTATPAEPAPLPTNPAPPPLPTATRDPSQPAPSLVIREVRGVGALADEALVIFNEGGSVQLAGWSVRDETGRLYQFPVLSLNQGGVVTLHTASGADTVTDLYWGQTTAVWAAGKRVLVSDAGGTLHTQYTIP